MTQFFELNIDDAGEGPGLLNGDKLEDGESLLFLPHPRSPVLAARWQASPGPILRVTCEDRAGRRFSVTVLPTRGMVLGRRAER
jgi:hypothetical protein